MLAGLSLRRSAGCEEADTERRERQQPRAGWPQPLKNVPVENVL